MKFLLAFGVAIGVILFSTVVSIKIHINTSQELQKYLCHQSLPVPKVIFELKRSNYNISGDFCIVNKSKNVVLYSNNSQPAIITCTQEDHPHPTRQGLAFISSNITIQRVTFVNCGTHLNTLPDNITSMFNSSSLYYISTHAATLLFIQCTVNMSDVVLTRSYGFAVIGINLIDSVLQNVHALNSNSSLQNYKINNQSLGSGIILHFLDMVSDSNPSYYKYKVSVMSSFFKNNYGHSSNSCLTTEYYTYSSHPVLNAAGLTIIYSQSSNPAQVNIYDSHFIHNVGSLAAGLLLLHYNIHVNATTVVNASIFDHNINSIKCYGAGLSFNWFANETINSLSLHPLLIQNSTFKNHYDNRSINTLSHNGAAYIGIVIPPVKELIVKLINVRFTRNYAKHDGVCLQTSVKKSPSFQSNVTIILDNITAESNGQVIAIPKVAYAGMFSFYEVNSVILKGTSYFKNNNGSVIVAVGSELYLSGHMEFFGNSGAKGAGIRLNDYCHIHFMNGLVANFYNNSANYQGGAIYAAIGSHHITTKCVFWFDDVKNATKKLNVTFSGNEAYKAGNSIYAQPIYDCYTHESIDVNKYPLNYTKLFHFSNTVKNSRQEISTEPHKLQPCSVEPENTYPGKIIYYSIAARDGIMENVYTTLTIDVILVNQTKGKVWLSHGGEEKVINEGQNCTNISFSIHTNINTTVNLSIIFSLPYYPFARYRYIKLEKCPLGFTLNRGKGICECSIVLNYLLHDFQMFSTLYCVIDTQTISKPPNRAVWIGAVKQSPQLDFGVSDFCPVEYCEFNQKFLYFYSDNEGSIYLQEERNVKLNHSICLFNREGTICGHCKQNLSVVFGSTECKHCSNTYLLTITFFIIAGPLLICILYALRLTLTTGTLNGIIFYANAANSGLIYILSLYSDHTHLYSIAYICIIFLSSLNISLGFPLCFYDGMTEFWKAGLSLLFPIYLLTIVVILIILSRYSTWLSNRIARSSVQVLVTVVHLSYSKLLLAVINVFTSSGVSTAEKNYTVWVWDGTMEYMKSKHLYLAIYTSVIAFPLIVSYTTFLLFAKILIRHSSIGNRYLRHLYEAIHAPYKEGHEYWFTVRLILLMMMYVVFTVMNANKDFLIFITVSPFLLLFLILQSFMKPFKNRLINMIDCWVMFNLTFLYVTTWYYMLSKKAYIATYFCVVAVLLIFITFIVILVYHILWVTGKDPSLHIQRMFNIILKVYHKMNEHRKPNSRRNVFLSDASGSFYDSCSQYREPILSPVTEQN